MVINVLFLQRHSNLNQNAFVGVICKLLPITETNVTRSQSYEMPCSVKFMHHIQVYFNCNAIKRTLENMNY